MCDLSLEIGHQSRDTLQEIRYGAAMQKKILDYFSYWAMSLFLFVATLLIVKWTKNSVPWDKLDSGWVQAIGSIAALVIAIYVMSRQNRHSARLIVAVDQLAFRRRAEAVKALIDRAQSVADAIHSDLVKPRDWSVETDDYDTSVNASKATIVDLLETVRAIPAHELGSYDMAEGLHLCVVNLKTYHQIVDEISRNQPHWQQRFLIDSLDLCIGHFRNSADQFRRGFKQLVNTTAP